MTSSFEVPTELLNSCEEHRTADFFFYRDTLERPQAEQVIRMCNAKERRPSAFLILETFGGDAAAAYKIARCFQKQYSTLIVYVPHFCKSAGTLLTLGAQEIVIGDLGEIGPLDIQLYKRDELGETRSALDIIQALTALQEKSFAAFEQYFLSLKGRSAGLITLRTAMEIASQMTIGLFTPIYQQINPQHLGEVARAMQIAAHYGERLEKDGGNLKEDSLLRLAAAYPTHGFVIDRKEAETLFKNVGEPTEEEEFLATYLLELTKEKAFVGYVSALLAEISGQPEVASASSKQVNEGKEKDNNGEPNKGGRKRRSKEVKSTPQGARKKPQTNPNRKLDIGEKAS